MVASLWSILRARDHVPSERLIRVVLRVARAREQKAKRHAAQPSSSSPHFHLTSFPLHARANTGFLLPDLSEDR